MNFSNLAQKIAEEFSDAQKQANYMSTADLVNKCALKVLNSLELPKKADISASSDSDWRRGYNYCHDAWTKALGCDHIVDANKMVASEPFTGAGCGGFAEKPKLPDEILIEGNRMTEHAYFVYIVFNVEDVLKFREQKKCAQQVIDFVFKVNGVECKKTLGEVLDFLMARE